ncbi:hypothetical protein [Leptospira santarosai]|uniref:hypothetical protein n=1 Tax=Leptospira santarosai TaxID=28183 RepID=UPI0009680091|nr:hypothetical protein [Leptospira santarosai]OLY64212.1 hypothetical protein BWD11_09025 [Leptospira santarosai serovar Grippotyphosa]ONF78067.1 hypothetical protein BWD12_13750 [Leptospira santarosai serovar Bananal]
MHLDLQAQNWIVYTVVSLTAIRLFFPLLSVIRELIGKSSGSETEDLGCYSGVCKSCDINPSSKKDDPILH